MTHLSLSLLGPLQIAVDGKAAVGFDSNKVRALLAYLAVEAARPHAREILAEWLWPDLPQGVALSKLRFSLSNLRATIGDRTAQPPFLLITNETLQFNSASDYSLDVRAFWESTEPGRLPDIEKLEQAVAQYRGLFMEGFAAGDSAALEEWIAFKRELFSRRMLNALRQLAEYFEGSGAYEQAGQYAWRQVELEPWLEEAHQQLMRTLALSGQRSAALAQYESCRRILDRELGVAPSAETIALYERIRDGTWPAQPTRLAAVPAFLRPDASPVQSEQPLFVAFESELARLERFVDQALAGRGQVAFVTGEPGRGKTMLVQEFAARALAAHPDLIAVSGNCNAQTGVGDPYLPFLEILHMLTGDVEAQWAAGAITSERARRLWTLLPEVVPALVDEGPELLDRLVPGAALLARAQIGAPTQAVRLDELLRRRTSYPDGAAVQQTDLFEQVTRVLQALARRHPLLLVVEDLQWADAGSINLLFHIGRRLAGQRILLIGTYRPSDVALGRDGQRHPLEPVVNELQRAYGDPCLDLAQADGRHFVEALLDSQPNRLGAAFGATLYQHTHGHPLFTVELLRGMQARGDLVQDAAGQWIEGASINWESLPPRVEAVIAERIGRLPAPLQATLAAASVQGEEFTVEAVARVQSEPASEVIRRLSGPLSKQHRLVSAAGVERLDEGHLSHYRFRHFLYQKYLYGGLDEVERVHMHEAMGDALETLYAERSLDIAAQLARHFEGAGLAAKAAGYLLAAGRRSVQLSADQEAIAHYRHGLALLATLPDSRQRAQQELALQMSLGVPLAGKGYADPEMGQAYGRAWELCQQLGATPELFPILTGLGGFYSLRAEFETSRAVYEEMLAVAERSSDPTLLTIGHWGMGYQSVVTGDLVAARVHLEKALSCYDRERHRALAAIYYHDPGASCLVWLSWALWALGYPDQAVQRSREALALAQELSHPLTQAFALALSGTLRYFRREPAEALPLAEAAIAVSSQYGFPFWRAGGVITRGWALANQDQDEAGLAGIGETVAFVRASGARQPLPTWLMTWAAACATQGRLQEGLRLMDEAQAELADRVGSVDEADQHRFRGDLLLQTGAGAEEAEACFQQAIELARRQEAKSWELRATLSLCRLWQSQGRHDEARQRLAAVVGWFTEGFDTPDLAEAAELLRELAGPLPRPTSPP